MNKERNDYYRLLLLQAKAGDNKSLDKLFDEFKPMVTRVARSYFLNDRDQADLVQEGMIGLYKAFLNYDMTSETSFYSYAYTCVYRQIISAVRSSLNQKNAPLSAYLSLETQNEILDDDDEEVELDFPSQDLTPEQVYDLHEREKELYQEIKQHLSEFELKVLRLYLKGKSYKDIANQLDKNEKSIDNAIVRIKGKLKFLEK